MMITLPKRSLLQLLFILMATVGYAQNMKVVSFRELVNDLTANRYGTSKTDVNGETAALIKIVTPEKGFSFDGGSVGIVDVDYKPGEIWLYVPTGSRRLTISHRDFGVLRNYDYSVSVEGAKTYEMLLDIGTGCYVTIDSEIAKSVIYIDGENCVVGPIYNKYLNYGRHVVKATKDRYEGIDSIYVRTQDDKTARVVRVDMRDISHEFADVTVYVDNNADIYYEGQNMGTTIWKTQLRQGSYTVETRKADCDSVKTSFIVKVGDKNEFHAAPPVPYTGFLNILTIPVNTTSLLDGSSIIKANETVTLPLGVHTIDYSARGYKDQRREYKIIRNHTVSDTVRMEEISYVRPNAFYFGGGATLRSLSGYTATLGMALGNNDFSVAYTFGNVESNIAYWSSTTDATAEVSNMAYKMNSIQAKYGYQIRLLKRIGFTPQVGFSYNTLSAVLKKGTNKYGDGASQKAITIGAKLLFVPVQHVYLFAQPEIGIGLSADNAFTQIAKAAGFSTTSLGATFGILVSF